MGIYDQRKISAYGLMEIDPSYAKNPYILKWWNSNLDELLVTQIAQWHWVWYWGITDEIVKVTECHIIETWKITDPLCLQYAWYNILMYFSAARADQLGFTKLIRPPKEKICLICENSFVEDSLPMPLIKRLGIDRLNFCAPCLRDSVLQSIGKKAATKNEILKYIQDLSLLIGRVPSQSSGEGIMDFVDLGDGERLALIKLLRNKPSLGCIKEAFGSWFEALIQSGILENGSRKNSRGIQTIAKDGHICFSLGEKMIDDYLYSHGIPHDKEPKYPEGNYRGDFKVGLTFIEYFGLSGNSEYDAKSNEKIRICKEHGIPLIAIYPKDLVHQQKLEHILSILEIN